MTAHLKTSRPLAVPIVAGEFADKTGFVIRVVLQWSSGGPAVDVRRFSPEGTVVSRGVSISAEKLPEFAAAINAALDVARDLGLVDAD